MFSSHREYVSNSEEPNDIQESDMNMNRRITAPSPQRTSQPSVPVNAGQSSGYTRQSPAPARKTVQHDADVYVDKN